MYFQDEQICHFHVCLIFKSESNHYEERLAFMIKNSFLNPFALERPTLYGVLVQ